MKRLIILFSLFCCAGVVSCFAQKKKVVDDMYGRDTSEAPKPTITNQRNFTIDNFADGFLIMPNDTLQYGQVRFNGSTAIFKDTLTQKIKRFGPRQIKGFVIGIDTFSVFNDTIVFTRDPFYRPYYRPYYGDQLVVNAKFIKEMVYGPKVSLFKAIKEFQTIGYTRYGGTSTQFEDAFYFKRKNENWYTYIPTNRRNFKRLMALYLGDAPDLLADINANRLTYDDIDEIVKRYNDTR